MVPGKASKALVVNFYKDRLYYMRMVYDAENVQRIGGFATLHARLVQKYGDPTEGNIHQESGVGTWRLGNTYIKADGTRSDGVVTLDVADVARARAAIEAQRAGSNTGF